jgi:adenylate cyclase class 2
MPREIEIKLRIPSAPSMRETLLRNGYTVLHPREREINLVFDSPAIRLIEHGQLLRLRRIGARTLLTYKGPAENAKHKSREEIEFTLDDGQALESVLGRLGFSPVFRYEKFRTEFTRPGMDGIVTVDETPIGDYIELEGPPAWIDETAHQLGFRESDYITLSYGALYQRHRENTPGAPRDMVFLDPSTQPIE